MPVRSGRLSRLPLLAGILPLLALLADSQSATEAPIFLTGRVLWPDASHSLWLNAARTKNLVTLQGLVPSAVIGPATVRTPYRVLFADLEANVGRIEVRGIHGLVTDSCARVHGDLVVVRGTHCLMVGGPQAGPVNMPFGLNVTSARQVVVEDSSFDNFQWRAPTGQYWNGDGITIEKDVAAARFERVSANDNTDGGFDVRPFAIMNDVSAAGNCRNFRLWNGGEVGTLTTGDSLKRGGISACSGIWLNGSGGAHRPRLHIARLIVRMRKPGLIFEVETGPADIVVDRCDIEAPAGTSMVEFEKGAGQVRMGVGCGLPASSR